MNTVSVAGKTFLRSNAASMVPNRNEVTMINDLKASSDMTYIYSKSSGKRYYASDVITLGTDNKMFDIVSVEVKHILNVLPKWVKYCEQRHGDKAVMMSPDSGFSLVYDMELNVAISQAAEALAISYVDTSKSVYTLEEMAVTVARQNLGMLQYKADKLNETINGKDVYLVTVETPYLKFQFKGPEGTEDADTRWKCTVK